MPLWTVAVSLVAGVAILLLGEPRRRTRVTINLIAAIAKVIMVAAMLWGVAEGQAFLFRMPLLPGVDLELHADALTLLLATLSAALWLVTTVYAIGYLEDSPDRCRFFGFFSICVAATTGVATAGNLLTFLIFYELLTLATWPLVVHRGTPEALRAGRVYLGFTLTGGALVMVGVVAVHTLAGGGAFTPGGLIEPDDASRGLLTAVFLVLFAGFGVKAALVPLHAWLPRAMIAPAPVSALLHAVAVVKAGAFGIIRLVYDVFGRDLTAALGMDRVVVAAATVTILYGSLMALRQTDLKRRLAYSTVSQVSYIVLGVGVLGPAAAVGGLVHLVHQGLMKITLFFCAGNFSEVAGVKTVTGMAGLGRRMPWTMAAFSLAALGMIGVPPIAGFVSKWYLGLGGVTAGAYWVPAVLVISTLLNAAYFLPLVGRGWLAAAPEGSPARGREAPAILVLPALASAGLAFGSGILAGMPFSPLQWVIRIVETIYAPAA